MIPKPYKYVLNYGVSTLEFEPSNWQDMELGLKREGHTLNREFSIDMTMYGDASTALQTLYEANGSTSVASVSIYKRNNSMVMVLFKTMLINFTSYTLKRGVVSVNLIENNLRKSIDDKKAVSYDILLPETNICKYTGVSKIRTNKLMPTQGNLWNYSNYKRVLPGTRQSGYSSNISFNDPSGSPYEKMFFRALATHTVTLEYCLGSLWVYQNTASGTVPRTGKMKLIKVSGSTETVIREWTPTIETTASGLGSYRNEYFEYPTTYTANIQLIAGDLVMLIFAPQDWAGITFTMTIPDLVDSPSFMKTTDVSVSIFNDYRVKTISCKYALEQLLLKMGLTATVDYNLLDTHFIPMLTSIQGLAQVEAGTVSLKFEEVIKALECWYGATVDYSDTQVIIDYQAESYKDELEANIPLINDFELKDDSTHVYGSIRVGYKTDDSSVENGQQEALCLNTFSLANNSKSELDLACPFKASPYTIEKILEDLDASSDTTTTADGDVFVLCCVPFTTTESILYKSYGYTNMPATYYNVPISPARILKANERYIAVGCKEGAIIPILSSTERFSGARVTLGYESVPVVELTPDLVLDTPLFNPVTLDFQTCIQIETMDSIKSNKYYTFTDKNTNKVYKGFVNIISLQLGKVESESFNLLAHGL